MREPVSCHRFLTVHGRLAKHKNKSTAPPLRYIKLKTADPLKMKCATTEMDDTYDSAEADSNMAYYFQALKNQSRLLTNRFATTY